MHEFVLTKMTEIDKRLQKGEVISVEDAHYYNIHHDAVVFLLHGTTACKCK